MTAGETELAEYLDRLVTQRRLSAHTVAAYRRDLAQFLEFCVGKGIERLTELDRNGIRRYLAYLQRKGLSKRSVARKSSAVRGFLGRSRPNVVSFPPTPPASSLVRGCPSVFPGLFPVASSARFLTNCPRARRSSCGIEAILEVLYGTGLRVSELAQLRVDDLEGDFVTVIGKGDKSGRCRLENRRVRP